ncbi:hypothetical protein DMENIID0001_074260 [Sergentomyia squamirostris]
MEFSYDSFGTSLVNSSLDDGSATVIEFDGSLTLSYEELTNINIDYVRYLGPRTYSLDLTGNDFTDLSFLCHFTKLHTLILDKNIHMFIRTLPHLHGLSTFWANNCNISNYSEFLAILADRCPNLKFICILNNPGIPSHIARSRFYSIILYRNFVINRFPRVVHLDECKVEEKKTFFQMAICYLYRRSRTHKLSDKAPIKVLFHQTLVSRKRCIKITIPRLF